MKRKSSLKILFILLSTILPVLPLAGENVRGEIVATIRGDGETGFFQPEQLVVVEAGDIAGFQEGLELRLGIPAGLRRYQNSFALFIYKNASPTPTSDNRAYSAGRAFMRLMPSRESMFVRIPLESGHDISGDALTDVVPVPVTRDEFPLLITVLPVMKGIPDRAFEQILEISAVTLVKNLGTLTVNLTNLSGDSDEEVTVTIDGDEVEAGAPVTLEAGIHRVRIDSSAAPTIERNVAVSPGEEIVLDLELDYRAPELLVSIPEGATCFLDGEELTGSGSTAIEIEPGDHTVSYRVGDLEVTRTFNIRPGGSVTIELMIDIGIVDFSEGGGNPFGAGDG